MYIKSMCYKCIVFDIFVAKNVIFTQKIHGRQKGTPNKHNIIKADELLLQLDINPMQKLIELAESDEATIDHKINCYKEIAKYTYPKHKSQDIRV